MGLPKGGTDPGTREVNSNNSSGVANRMERQSIKVLIFLESSFLEALKTPFQLRSATNPDSILR